MTIEIGSSAAYTIMFFVFCMSCMSPSVRIRRTKYYWFCWLTSACYAIYTVLWMMSAKKVGPANSTLLIAF
jgi:drug/metabolite transporter (DMT)-like permease